MIVEFENMEFKKANAFVADGMSNETELALYKAGFTAVSPRENLCDRCANFFDCNFEVDCSSNGLIVTKCPWHLDGTKEVKE